MAVKTKEEILNTIKEIVGENTDDNYLGLLEDITDTLDNYEGLNTDNTDWKTKYEENDKEWRQKYKDRFFSREVEEDNDLDNDEPEPVKVTFDDLFVTNEQK